MKRDRRHEQVRGGAHPDLHDRPGYLLWRCNKAFTMRARELLREDGVAWDHYLVLTVLGAIGEAQQIVIVERTGLDRMRVTRAADDLEDEGLITRGYSSRDRRSRTAAISPTGREALVTAKAAVALAENEAFGRLSRQERSELERLLRRCVPRLQHPLAGLGL